MSKVNGVEIIKMEVTMIPLAAIDPHDNPNDNQLAIIDHHDKPNGNQPDEIPIPNDNPIQAKTEP